MRDFHEMKRARWSQSGVAKSRPKIFRRHYENAKPIATLMCQAVINIHTSIYA